jgi:hypothetical protein
VLGDYGTGAHTIMIQGRGHALRTPGDGKRAMWHQRPATKNPKNIEVKKKFKYNTYHMFSSWCIRFSVVHHTPRWSRAFAPFPASDYRLKEWQEGRVNIHRME